MPVSRSRKKKKGRAVPAGRRPTDIGTGSWQSAQSPELARSVAGLMDHRARLDEVRSAFAATSAAAALSDHLIDLAGTGTDAEFEDALCAWLGPWLNVDDGAPLEEQVNPNDAFDALVHAASDRVATALDRWDAESEVGLRSMRVLAALAAIAPKPMDEHVAQVVADLRRGRKMLPPLQRGPRLAGEVRWARDAYGSRFGIIAPFDVNGLTRWYLWDVDACGFEVFVVFSGYFGDADQAGEVWRAGVGEVAVASSTFELPDDADLLAQVLPSERDILRIGGESVEQLSEYHRSICLADIVRAAMRKVRTSPVEKLNAETATPLFAAWLAEHRPGLEQPEDELLDELMESWMTGEEGIAFAACSPHRIASKVEDIKDYYQDDYFAQLVALLPDWVAFLADYNGTPPHLVERCLPFLSGAPGAPAAPHPGIGDNCQVRVTE